MALKNLTTKFRSLKFGNDNKSPYVVTSLPSGFNDPFTGPTKVRVDNNGLSGDFPVRGGVSALTTSGDDTTRIFKFFADAPKGPVFIAKQVGLQLSNPKLETGKTFGLIENTRIYNLGLNTLAQIPVNAFGIHFDRAGLLPTITDQNKYENIVTRKNLNTITGGESDPNRLVKLYNDKIHIVDSSVASKVNKKIQDFTSKGLGKLLNNITKGSIKTSLQRAFNPKYFVIDNYIGGPGSVYGIGTTTINRYVFTDNPRTENIGVPLTINYANLLGASYRYPYNFDKGIKDDPTSTPDFLTQTIPSTFKKNSNIESIAYSYDTIQRQKIASSTDNYVGLIGPDFRKIINGQSPFDPLPSTDYKTYNMQTRIGIGDQGSPNRPRLKINSVYETSQDRISMLPLFSEDISANNGGEVTLRGEGKPRSTRDLVKFRFEAVDNDNVDRTIKMVFRAFISNFSDGFSADWNAFKYTGRGENFQTYQGFDRKFSFDLKIVAQSRAEMKPLYQKLNYLISNVTPDYSQDGFMRAPFILFTLGNYFYRQPSVINSLNINMDDQQTWEIAMDHPEAGDDLTVSELPQALNVSIQLTLIHNFIPKKGPTTPFIRTGPVGWANDWIGPSNFKNL